MVNRMAGELLDKQITVASGRYKSTENISLRDWVNRQLTPNKRDEQIIAAVRELNNGGVLTSAQMQSFTKAVVSVATNIYKDNLPENKKPTPDQRKNIVDVVEGRNHAHEQLAKIRREFTRTIKADITPAIPSVCIPVDERVRVPNMEYHTGIYVFDADLWDDPSQRKAGWDELKTIPQVVGMYISSSGLDFAVFVAGPAAENEEEHKNYFAKIAHSLPAFINKAVDAGQHNSNRLRFASHCSTDEIYLNEDAVAFLESEMADIPDSFSQAAPQTPQNNGPKKPDFYKTEIGIKEALKENGILCRYNNRSHKNEFYIEDSSTMFTKGLANWPYEEQPDGWIPFDEHITIFLLYCLEQTCVTWNDKKGEYIPFRLSPFQFEKHLNINAIYNNADPFKIWLSQFKTGAAYSWNAANPSVLGQLFTDAFGCVPNDPHSQEYLEHAAVLIMLPVIGRTYVPGAESSTVAILVGDEGVGKSYGVASLFPAEWRDCWFTDTVTIADRGKELVEKMAGKVLGELSELAGMGRAEIERIKQMLSSRQESNIRLSYRRDGQDYPRKWGLVGTVNDTGAGVLPDDITNRRFWPIEIPRTTQHENAIKWINDHRMELWSEAMWRWEEWNTSAWRNPAIIIDEVRETAARNRRTSSTADLADEIESLGTVLADGFTIAELLALIKAFGTRRVGVGDSAEEEPIPAVEIAQKIASGTSNTMAQSLGRELRHRGWDKKRSQRSGEQAVRWYAPKSVTGEPD